MLDSRDLNMRLEDLKFQARELVKQKGWKAFKELDPSLLPEHEWIMHYNFQGDIYFIDIYGDHHGRGTKVDVLDFYECYVQYVHDNTDMSTLEGWSSVKAKLRAAKAEILDIGVRTFYFDW